MKVNNTLINSPGKMKVYLPKDHIVNKLNLILSEVFTLRGKPAEGWFTTVLGSLILLLI